ncbi:MAG: phosphate ABC transporter permease PstA, partial [Stellaceae bacterium]
MMGRYARRRVTNYVYLTLSMAATAAGLVFLFLVLWALIRNGLPALSGTFFTAVTPPPGSAGGLANAIYGSVAMTVVATLVGTPIGMLTGTYLAEYGKASRLAPVVRFVNDILLSAPSIIIGLFVYQIVVVPMGHFSAWAGSIALALIVIPVVVRTT